MAKKAKHHEDMAFRDYTRDQCKIYKHLMREMKTDVEQYDNGKGQYSEEHREQR